jgi:hypothetical protein
MQHHNLIKKILFSCATAVALLLIPLTAYAQNSTTDGLDQLQNASGGQLPTAGVDVSSPEGVINVIAQVINWALYLSGAIAVVFVIIGGYRYLTAGGNEESATKGRKSVVNALIGLVIIVLAYVIVNAVASFFS